MQPKDTFFSRKLTINCRGELIDLSKPRIMGILNATPDSFYDGGKHSSAEYIQNHVEKMIAEGCDILDIGAYSSRPGAAEVSVDEELKRLDYVLKIVREKFSELVISVDTFRAEVAKKAVQDYQVDIINDISAGGLDATMFETVAELSVPYIMMHMKGVPRTMQKDPYYDNVVKEVIKFFSQKLEKLKLMGIHDVILDPGFGFGKNVDHNFQLLKYLDDFKVFEIPLLIGVSRKRMINRVLGTSPETALNGTTIINTIALLNGANILRVHDVKEAKEAVKLIAKYKETKVDNWHE